MDRCRICGNAEGNKLHAAREMMLGFRDHFEYVECAMCGTLEIRRVPPDLSRFYPKGYYSFRTRAHKDTGFFKNFLLKEKTKYWLYGKNPIGALLAVNRKKAPPSFIDWAKKAGIRFCDKILDVGCGGGNFIRDMKRYGFRNVSGIDSFIESDIAPERGVKIFKTELGAINGEYDFIMLNHSFEHMADPLDALKDIHRLLKHRRFALIRIPVSGTYAWRKYGTDWFQLDAPRHIFLHTIKGMRLLAESSMLKVSSIVFDSDEAQFWGSEQYVKDIPLYDSRSYAVSPRDSIFSEKEIAEFKNKAVELNAAGDGDQACFYLYKD